MLELSGGKMILGHWGYFRENKPTRLAAAGSCLAEGTYPCDFALGKFSFFHHLY